MAGNKREFWINFFGKETVSGAAKKAERAVDDLGDGLSDTAKDAKRLDAGIADVEKSLKSLASQYAKTGDDSFIKQIREQERELRKLKKARTLLGDIDEDDGGKRVVMGLAKQLRGGGKQFSEAIGEGLTAAPTPVKVAVGAAVVAGIAGASSAIGAAVGGAVTVGLAGGAIGLGVKAAFQDARIQEAGTALVDDLKKNLFEPLGEDFKAPVLAGIDEIRSQVPLVGDALKRAISPAAKYVEPLVFGFTGLVRNVLPGFAKAIQRAAPVIDVISDHLPRVGRALSMAFDDMSKNSKNAAGGVELVLRFLEGSIIAGGKIVGFLTDAFDVTMKWQLAAGLAAEKFLGWIPGVGGKLHDFNTATGQVVQTTRGANESTSSWADKLKTLGGNLTANEQSTEQLRQRQQILNTTMRGGIEAAGGLSEAFEVLNGKALGSREAESNYQAAIDDLNASIKENGKTLDLHTEKGRANDAAVRNLIATTATKAQATYDETLATKGAEAAQAAASKVYEDGRVQLVKSLTQILGNKEAAKKLADEIMKIPKSWSTTVNTNTGTAWTAVTKFEKKINTIDGRVITVTARFNKQGNLYIPGQGTSLKFAGGGEIPGPGPKGIDSKLIMAAPGEYMLDNQDVNALGGPRAIDAWRRSLHQGGAASLPTVMPAAGSPAATGGGGRYRVELELLGEREIVSLFTRLIKQYSLLEV